MHAARRERLRAYTTYAGVESRLIHAPIPAAGWTLAIVFPEAGRGAADILTAVNAGIADGNERGMFVTVFCAVLDLATGELAFVNAGHNPPLLVRRGAAPACPAAGPQRSSWSARSTASPIATSASCFSPATACCSTPTAPPRQRPRRRILFGGAPHRGGGRAAGKSVRGMVEHVLAAVHALAEGAEPSDDITLMLLEYRGPA